MVIPIAWLAVPKARASACGLYVGSLFSVLGFITKRLNGSIAGLEATQGGHYVPALSEVIINLMLTAIGFGAFSLAVRNLNVFSNLAEQVKDQTPMSTPGARRDTAGTTSMD